ncbi:MAG: aminotransferase class I/II-fold pyridoxal phosphate-dependent enzyme [Acidimicrobiaceae bacterium]|nr:aminotransferase class I/II-fold pyridoxal phosphate-dependent enzyme [Acidimicrobiaceae bacterium]
MTTTNSDTDTQAGFAHYFCDVDPQRKRVSRNLKWRQYPADVVPAWIAEHDFRPPDTVVNALTATIKDYAYGYNDLENDAASAFVGWVGERYGWDADPELTDTHVGALAAVTAVITALTEPGDGVIVTPPIYNMFLEICPTSHRCQLEWLMRYDTNNGWHLHPDDLETLLKNEPKARVLLWCNPHNPTGWVPDQEALVRIVELAHTYDFYVVSDEIHSDIIHPPASFTPMLTIPGAAERVITVTSPAKTFVLSGLCFAVTAYGDATLRERVQTAHPPLLLGNAPRTGLDAAIAAWHTGSDWVDALIAELTQRRDQLQARLTAEAPEIRFHAPQSTFLAWLDMSSYQLGVTPGAHLLEHARVAVQEGTMFGTNGDNHVRLNFGTSQSILDEIIDRIVSCLNGGCA